MMNGEPMPFLEAFPGLKLEEKTAAQQTDPSANGQDGQSGQTPDGQTPNGQDGQEQMPDGGQSNDGQSLPDNGQDSQIPGRSWQNLFDMFF